MQYSVHVCGLYSINTPTSLKGEIIHPKRTKAHFITFLSDTLLPFWSVPISFFSHYTHTLDRSIMALETITQQQQQYLCALLGSTNWSVGSDSGSGSGSGSALDYYNNEGFDEFLTNNQNVSAPQEYDDYSNWNLPPPLLVDSQNEFHEWDQTFSVLDHNFTIPDQQEQLPALGTPVENCSSTTRPRRRRTRTKKNEEEIENQRITHIAVERNRRKQMNEYLSVLRTLMPQSYVQRVRIFLLLLIYQHFRLNCLITSSKFYM